MKYIDGPVVLHRLMIPVLPDFLSDVEIRGTFDCSYNDLKTLKNCPSSVTQNFICKHNKLSDLIGSPKEVKGYYDCSHNQLESFKGAPTTIYKDFTSFNNQIKSLEGIPKHIKGDFWMSDNRGKEFTEEEIRAVSNIKGLVFID